VQFAIAALLCVVFAMSVRLVGLAAVCRQAVLRFRVASLALFDAQLSDERKQRLALEAARDFLLFSIAVVVRGGAALLPPAAAVWLLDAAGVSSWKQMMAALQTAPVILFGAVAMLTALRAER
jgi:hypothetical protein